MARQRVARDTNPIRRGLRGITGVGQGIGRFFRRVGFGIQKGIFGDRRSIQGTGAPKAHSGGH